jgi:serine/threonine protein kinase
LRFHEAEGPARDAGERALAFWQLLRRFVDVCNAIAYAHSRGVLHRDLKPGNVMLGPYGETLVVDWGLAKAVGKREPAAPATGAEEITLRPASAVGSPPTEMGKAIGTPQFMPPEQAAGRLDELGPASDVYSLGATLYCLLTGQAPFERADVGLVLQRVGRGEFPAPRQVKRPGVSVPAALEAVCLKAMALKPADRYPSPHALADDIEHWLADEPVSAWPEPLPVKAARWMRRHKAKVSGTAAAVLVGLAALTGWLIWYQGHRAEAVRKLALTEQAASQGLDQAQGIRDELQKKLAQRGGAFELLNHPEDWQARLEVA